MDHLELRQTIESQRDELHVKHIAPRSYALAADDCCPLVGLRRSGKSALLADHVQKLVSAGVSWSQIIYLDFEDVRLAEFGTEDFSDIVDASDKPSDQKTYYFFDEIQHIEGWRRLSRHLAEEGQAVCIACSTATIPMQEMAAQLGGRFAIIKVMPYSFSEYLDVQDIPHTGSAHYATDSLGRIQRAAGTYLHAGGFLETAGLMNSCNRREFIYRRILEHDIILPHQIRKPDLLRSLLKMLAERSSEETSATALTRTMGILSSRKLSPDMAASYLRAAEDAHLIFRMQSYAALSAESTPRWHFGDNGILDLFLYNKDSLLLENAVALALLRRYGKDHIFYFKSSKTGIDIDFYIPEASWAIQACYMLDGSSFERETKSLAELAQDAHLAPERSTIVTLADS